MPRIAFLLSFILLLSGASCSDISVGRPVHEEVNGVYYWKTNFTLDDENLSQLRDHDIGRIYLRMFDVVENEEARGINHIHKSIPNASVTFGWSGHRWLDSIVGTEFVPVVYITLEALRAEQGKEGALAEKILTRVRNMCSYNRLHSVRELQLDCDWTATTETSFFALCDSVRSLMARMEQPWRLSSTIRLHQLARQAPPVDCGVLMVYNTGNFNDPDEANSIISEANVAPYLRNLRDYPLHLDVAYPTYSWQLLFRHRQFMGLMNYGELDDTTRFENLGGGRFKAHRAVPYKDKVILPGDIIRRETSAYAEIMRVKTLIERELDGRPHSNILYHLDSANLSEYTSDELDNIFAQHP